MSPSTAPAQAWSPDDESMLAVGNLGDLLGFHLRLAQTAMYRDFATSLGALDLTQKQFATLSLISSNPGVPQIALANRLGTDRATMMAVVDRLEGRGLILRQRSTTDRRRQELYVTPLGETTLGKARAAIIEHERKFTSRFTPEENAALLKALRTIHRQD